MPFIIGTDEAGYGPNFGPLVIGGTLWHTTGSIRDDLYPLLSNIVADPTASKAPSQPNEKILIADSKSLFQSGGSLKPLERAILAVLLAMDFQPTHIHELFQFLGDRMCKNEVLEWHEGGGREVKGQDLADLETYHWERVTIPQDCNWEALGSLAERWSNACQRSGVRCLDVKSEAIFAKDFNLGLQDLGNKATLLSMRTCQLASFLVAMTKHMEPTTECSDGEPLPRTPGREPDVLILCDKHGGRSHYAGLIQHVMTDSPVEVLRESREISQYRWRDEEQVIEMQFIAGGERHLPVALASMTAKYMRELSMQAWNCFWRDLMPELKPTAGYPTDARRFKYEIAELQAKIGIDDQTIWRSK